MVTVSAAKRLLPASGPGGVSIGAYTRNRWPVSGQNPAAVLRFPPGFIRVSGVDGIGWPPTPAAAEPTMSPHHSETPDQYRNQPAQSQPAPASGSHPASQQAPSDQVGAQQPPQQGGGRQPPQQRGGQQRPRQGRGQQPRNERGQFTSGSPGGQPPQQRSEQEPPLQPTGQQPSRQAANPQPRQPPQQPPAQPAAQGQVAQEGQQLHSPAHQPTQPQGMGTRQQGQQAGVAQQFGGGRRRQPGLESATIDGIVETDVVTVEPDTSISEVVGRMSAENVGSVVITEGQTPVGIITDRSLALALEASPDLSEVTANDFRTSNLITGTLDMSVFDVIARMEDESIRRLPIVEDGELAGIVTLDDVMVMLNAEMANVTSVIQSQSPRF